MMHEKIYALYKGDKLLSMGTLKEIAKQQGVKPRTIYFYKSKAYKERQARNSKRDRRVLVCVED